MAEQEKETGPWWKDKLLITLIGLVIPAATLVQGTLQRQRELALQEQRHAQEIELQKLQYLQELRISYLNVIVEAGVEGLGMVAEFSAATETDEVIKAWARSAAKSAEQSIQEIQQSVQQATEKAAGAQAALERAEQRAQLLESESAALQARATAERQEHQQQLEKAQKEAEQARLAGQAATDEISRGKDQLGGRKGSTSMFVRQEPSATMLRIDPRVLSAVLEAKKK